MMRMVLLLAIVQLAPAENSKAWADQIDTDKSNINAQIKSLEDSRDHFLDLEQDHAKIKEFATTAHQDANARYHTSIENARSAYKTAQANLQSGTGTEKQVKESKEKLEDLVDEEKNYATKKLHDIRQSHLDVVKKTLGGLKNEVHQMKKDRNDLEDARRSDGWSEREFEDEEMHNEMWAERSQSYAERQKDNATDTVDRVFGRAEDELESLMTSSEAKDDSFFLAASSPASFAPSIFLGMLALASLGLSVVRFLSQTPTQIIVPESLLG